MTSKNEDILAFALAAVLLVVGVICYAAFPQRSPEQPVRLIFKTTAGSILFDHSTHTREAGYGIACEQCHHEEHEDGSMSCSGQWCHGPDSEPTRVDALHSNCKGCHEESEMGPVKCSACHVMK